MPTHQEYYRSTVIRSNMVMYPWCFCIYFELDQTTWQGNKINAKNDDPNVSEYPTEEPKLSHLTSKSPQNNKNRTYHQGYINLEAWVRTITAGTLISSWWGLWWFKLQSLTAMKIILLCVCVCVCVFVSKFITNQQLGLGRSSRPHNTIQYDTVEFVFFVKSSFNRKWFR